jgi:hypothetical protein
MGVTGMDEQPFITRCLDQGSEKEVKRKRWNILTPHGGGETPEADRRDQQAIKRKRSTTKIPVETRQGTQGMATQMKDC